MRSVPHLGTTYRQSPYKQKLCGFIFFEQAGTQLQTLNDDEEGPTAITQSARLCIQPL